MATRLARFFALPEVILELASGPHASDEKLLRQISISVVFAFFDEKARPL